MKTTHLDAGFHLWRPLDNDIEIGIMKMICTWDLCYDISTDTAEVPYDCRYSYETEKEAIDAFYAWDGEGFPLGNWIKRKSHQMVDLINPNLQTEGSQTDS